MKYSTKGIDNLHYLSAMEKKVLLDTLEKEYDKKPFCFNRIIIQNDNYKNEYDIISSFYRGDDNTAMEVVEDGQKRIFLIINIFTSRKRIKNTEDINKSTLKKCRNYRESFENRILHEIGHLRHLTMSEKEFENIVKELPFVSEYAYKSDYEKFAEAYSINKIGV